MLYDANDAVTYTGGIQSQLNAAILQNDEEVFLRLLDQSRMFGAAKVFADARGLPFECPPARCALEVSIGTRLEFGKRKKRVFDWPVRKQELADVADDA